LDHLQQKITHVVRRRHLNAVAATISVQLQGQRFVASIDHLLSHLSGLNDRLLIRAIERRLPRWTLARMSLAASRASAARMAPTTPSVIVRAAYYRGCRQSHREHKGRIAGVYNRATYEPQKAAALKKLGA
jgi:hypothetical protein